MPLEALGLLNAILSQPQVGITTTQPVIGLNYINYVPGSHTLWILKFSNHF